MSACWSSCCMSGLKFPSDNICSFCETSDGIQSFMRHSFSSIVEIFRTHNIGFIDINSFARWTLISALAWSHIPTSRELRIVISLMFSSRTLSNILRKICRWSCHALSVILRSFVGALSSSCYTLSIIGNSSGACDTASGYSSSASSISRDSSRSTHSVVG